MTRWLVIGTFLLGLGGVATGCGGQGTESSAVVAQPTLDEIEQWLDEHRAALNEQAARHFANLFSTAVGEAAKSVSDKLLEDGCEPTASKAADDVASLASKAFADGIPDNRLDLLRDELRAHDRQVITEWFDITG